MTSLGASVVSVDHLRTAPARSPRARLMLGLGAALLAGSALTFGAGVWSAQRDDAARARWTAEGRPAWAFRPTRHGHAADLLALGGALAGLGLVVTGLLARTARTRTSLTVGQNDGVDLPLADAPPALTLVAPDGQGGFVANLAGLTGDVRQGGRTLAIEQLIATGRGALPITTDTHVRAQLGRTTFHVKGLDAPAAATGPAPLLVERKVLAFVAASAVAHLGVIGLLRTVPPDQQTAAVDHQVSEETTVLARLHGNEDPAPPEPVDGEGHDGTPGASSTLVSMALEDGTLGAPDGSATPAKLRVMDRGLAPQLAREQAIAMAREAGVLGSIASPIAVYQGGDLASGLDDLDITGGLFEGGGTGVPVGTWGTGIRGMSTGCGRSDGKPCAGVRSEAWASVGWKGDKDALNLANRPGTGPDGRHRPVVPPITAGKPECVGETCLDRDLVRRYVARNLAKITYCYERELLAQPGLEGTVTALFTLDGNGAVIDSKASGVDPNVSSCIATVLSTIHFPKVGPPGIYPIKYPFKLRPTGR